MHGGAEAPGVVALVGTIGETIGETTDTVLAEAAAPETSISASVVTWTVGPTMDGTTSGTMAGTMAGTAVHGAVRHGVVLHGAVVHGAVVRVGGKTHSSPRYFSGLLNTAGAADSRSPRLYTASIPDRSAIRPRPLAFAHSLRNTNLTLGFTANTGACTKPTP